MKKAICIAAIAALVPMLLTGCVKDAMSSQQAPAATAAGEYRLVVATEQSADLRNSISVNAKGEMKLMPDVAYATVGVVSMNAKLKTAQTDNKTKMDAVYKALNDQGITKDNIRTDSYSVNPQYDYTDGKTRITGYEVVNTVEVTVNDIGAVGDILDACSAAGANTAYPIRFDIKDKTTAYNEALKLAVETAKAKAEIAAKAAGVTLAGIMKLEESYSSYGAVYEYPAEEYERAASDKAAPQTQITAGEMTITANVQILYEINN